ncbi:MAG: 50S ribosomal protein L3 [Candidatus Paceibacterota bacterium]|jgi:large subunit ribosomal protein L3
MKFILGTKEYMSQIFDDKGTVHPVTVINAAANVVTQVKTKAKDGYDAAQVAYGTRKHISKSVAGHVKELGKPKAIKEFRFKRTVPDLARGSALDLTQFKEGDVVHVSGTSKGKGFQGVIKRHGFHGGPRSHGQKHSEHAPGSLGAGGIQRVFRGKKMGGRMGSDRVTVRNLKIVRVDSEAGKLFIEGAVPGRRGTLLEIRSKN